MPALDPARFFFLPAETASSGPDSHHTADVAMPMPSPSETSSTSVDADDRVLYTRSDGEGDADRWASSAELGAGSVTDGGSWVGGADGGGAFPLFLMADIRVG